MPTFVRACVVQVLLSGDGDEEGERPSWLSPPRGPLTPTSSRDAGAAMGEGSAERQASGTAE